MVRDVLVGLATFALLPLVLLVDAVQTDRFERLRRGALACVEVTGSSLRAGEERFSAGDVVRARAWSHERATMASGPEELLVLEIELRDGRRLRFTEPASGAVAAALTTPCEPARPMGSSGGLRPMLLLVWCAVVAAIAVIARALAATGR